MVKIVNCWMQNSTQHTFAMYSDSKSCSAWRTALHSVTMRSRRSSRVQSASAINAAALIICSNCCSNDGRECISLYANGSMTTPSYWWEQNQISVCNELEQLRLLTSKSSNAAANSPAPLYLSVGSLDFPWATSLIVFTASHTCFSTSSRFFLAKSNSGCRTYTFDAVNSIVECFFKTARAAAKSSRSCGSFSSCCLLAACLINSLALRPNFWQT